MKRITRKSMLYKSDVEYADYSANYVLGCAHGCTFPCYAFNLKKRTGDVKTYEEWIDPKIVSNTLELLDKELPKLKHKIKEGVHLCFSTDPFMVGYPEVTALTLDVLTKLNSYGVRAQTLTKGVTSSKLTDVERYGEDNFYGITLVSLDETFRQRWEPFSAPYTDRIAAIKELHDAGLKTWVSIEPYPTPNIVEQELINILDAVGFVDRIVFGKWNYNPISSKKAFKDAKGFYADAAFDVTDYCDASGKEVHIKEGTA